MRMAVNENHKTVKLWLTNEEKNDADFRESLKPLFQRYKEQRYLVAVFFSGEEELYQQTRDLLLYNRRRHAEGEARVKRPVRAAMER